MHRASCSAHPSRRARARVARPGEPDIARTRLGSGHGVDRGRAGTEAGQHESDDVGGRALRCGRSFASSAETAAVRRSRRGAPSARILAPGSGQSIPTGSNSQAMKWVSAGRNARPTSMCARAASTSAPITSSCSTGNLRASNLASLRLQIPEAGFVARRAVSVGETIVVVGDLAHNLWQEAASATLRCTQ
jgi:hypothetical protein